MGPLEFCAMLCDNTERALSTLRHDVCTALRNVEEASRASEWTRGLEVTSRLHDVLVEIDQLLTDLEDGSVCLSRACLDLLDDADSPEVELLRIELEALRHSAIAGLRVVTETLPRAVDAFDLPSVLATTALETSDIVVRRDVVLCGSSLLDALRELLVACGRVGAPLREIVRHSTVDSWNDLQVVECLNDTVSLALDRGLRFVLGTVDTRALVPAAAVTAPSSGLQRSRTISDRMIKCVLPWWGMSYECWLETERSRVRRVNRFALWSGRGKPTRLFLFPAETELGGPVLLLGDKGHHPVMSRFAQSVGTLNPERHTGAGNRAIGSSRTRRDALLVGGCPPGLRDGVRRQLQQVSRKPVVFR
jgi:hypothetical protein